MGAASRIQIAGHMRTGSHVDLVRRCCIPFHAVDCSLVELNPRKPKRLARRPARDHSIANAEFSSGLSSAKSLPLANLPSTTRSRVTCTARALALQTYHSRSCRAFSSSSTTFMTTWCDPCLLLLRWISPKSAEPLRTDKCYALHLCRAGDWIASGVDASLGQKTRCAASRNLEGLGANPKMPRCVLQSWFP